MSDTAITNYILAVCTTQRESVVGSAPIFYCQDEQELQATATALEKIMDAMAHEIRPGVVIMVKH
ncbi:MAG: capping complex subunit for YIEGIA [Tumebacillaceae bacterium]